MSVASSGYMFLITPDDDNDLEEVTKALSFATAGAIKIDDAVGNTLTIPAGALVAGVQHAVRIKKVYETGTTATGLLGFS